jgi:hypothetical protein
MSSFAFLDFHSEVFLGSPGNKGVVEIQADLIKNFENTGVNC